jgi:hypothetical protein
VIVGEVWYNATSNVLKFDANNVTSAGSWSSGVSLNTARAYLGSTGIQTAALAIGGTTATPATVANVEVYDGSGWTETGDLNTARCMLGASGTTTAALAFGGNTGSVPSTTDTNINESFNGSNWTETTDMNTARRALIGCGTSTAALGFGGRNGGYSALTEQWNGSNWTEVSDLNTGRQELSGTGDVTAALAFGGQVPSGPGNSGATESWNGSAWTTVPATLNKPRGTGNSSKVSALTALFFGGDQPVPPGRTAETELYNGTSWVEQNDMSQIRRNLGGAGSGGTSALAFGGEVAPITAVTEHWTGAGAPIGAWATGGSLNTARKETTGVGIQTAALIIGGS